MVEALAGALRLAPDERAYLFGLAQQRPRNVGKPATTAAPQLARLVDDLSPLPAMLMNHRYDILAWNREIARLLLDFDTLPPQRRNAMWLCLLHPEIREFYVDATVSCGTGSPTCVRGPRASGGSGTVRPHRRVRHPRRGVRPAVGQAGHPGQRPGPQGDPASRRRRDRLVQAALDRLSRS